MNWNHRWSAALIESVVFARRALRGWTPRQILVATASAIGVGIVLGIATVLIPNGLFTREIPPVWWNYPVWIATSAMTGVLIATYIRPHRRVENGRVHTEGSDASTPTSGGSGATDREERRTGRFAITGGLLAWFAVGCPVCNKIAVLALGSTGALTWFAPLQPVLAVAALVLSTVAVVWRLRGQVVCPLPFKSEAVTA
jgi:hypothetical protein